MATHAPEQPVTKKKIAVLGGGAASLFAVLAITDAADWRDHYDITIYQQGWRLGGKGASSRDPAKRGRNEEHGLHIFGGFYHNTFRWLRSCYREWGQVDHAHAISFDDAFTRVPVCTLMEKQAGGWRQVDIDLPVDDRLPGVDPRDPGIVEMLRMLVAFMLHQLPGLAALDAFTMNPLAAMFAEEVRERVERSLDQLEEAILAPPVGLDDPFVDLAADLLAQALAGIRNICLMIEPFVRPAPREPNMAMVTAFAAVVTIGMLRDRTYRLGYDVIENEETRAWLRRHGANQRLLDAPYPRAGYDYIFGYAGGQTVPPAYSLSAGVSLRWFLRMMLTYHGALFWHMEGGMGEIVFTPLYTVLRARGVAFAFFNRVRALRLNDAATAIDAIEVDVQAVPQAASYDPLIDWNGRKAWPSRPRYELLEDGDRLRGWNDDLECAWTPVRNERRTVLRLGIDFDQVVLGIPVGALPVICADLRAKLPKWDTMLSAARTLPAAGVQIWSLPDTAALGWTGPAPGIVTAFAQPFATWADMSYLLALEDRTAPGPQPKHLSYYCGPLELRSPPPGNDGPGSTFPADEHARLLATMTTWLNANLADLLPGAAAGDYRHEIFARANVSPADHYVLSPPGGRLKRLRADESGVANLFLAGDWTRNGLDAGAFEGAVMSGLQCATAVTGRAIPVHGGE